MFTCYLLRSLSGLPDPGKPAGKTSGWFKPNIIWSGGFDGFSWMFLSECKSEAEVTWSGFARVSKAVLLSQVIGEPATSAWDESMKLSQVCGEKLQSPGTLQLWMPNSLTVPSPKVASLNSQLFGKWKLRCQQLLEKDGKDVMARTACYYHFLSV